MKKLHISPDLALPLEYVTKTIAILAQRRKGKTYTASVLAEELIEAKIPNVALDPTGAWWGLRAAADGKGEGLPVVILGGQHADLPLERTAGKFVAELVVDQPGYYVIDLSLFESAEAERQFATDFAERLYRLKGHAGRDFPLHLFVDEADRFIPQRPMPGEQRMLGAFEAIVRRGGLRGIGTTVITQRAAVINKNVLEQIDTLIVLRIVGPNDQDAVRRYVKAKGTPEELKQLDESMASLRLGEAWVWEPGSEPYLFQRVQMRERRTFNSSATPKAGEKRIEPKKMAPVDLEAIKSRMSETIERAKENDPRELKAQLARLKAELVRAQTAKPAAAAKAPKVDQAELKAQLDRAIGRALKERDQMWQRAVVHYRRDLDRAIGEALKLVNGRINTVGFVHPEDLKVDVKIERPPAKDSTPAVSSPDAASGTRGRVSREAIGPAAGVERSESVDITKPMQLGEKKILIAIAQSDDGADRAALTIMTGYKRSTRDRYLQYLQARGYVAQNGNGRIHVTQEGMTSLGSDFEPLPVGEELREHWLNRLPKGEAEILRVVCDAYPEPAAKDAISEKVGLARSSRDRYIQYLAARQLVHSAGAGAVIADEKLFG